MNRISSEILSQIFVWTEALFRAEHGTFVSMTEVPVYRIYRVCKGWRRIALDTPGLWTCVAIKGVRSLVRGEKWLEHAKRRLCTVWIRTTRKRFTPEAAFELWTRHLDHLQHLELNLTCRAQQALVWPDVHSGLSSLIIRGPTLDSVELSKLLSFIPKLERLVVSLDSEHLENGKDVEIQRTRLTQLDLNYACFREADDFLPLLRSCPDLALLHIRHGRMKFTAADNLAPVELSKLKAISLPWSELTMGLLHLLITPALRTSFFNTRDDVTCDEMKDDLENGALGDYGKELGYHSDFELQDPEFVFFWQRLSRVESLVVDHFDPFTSLRPIIDFLTTPKDDGKYVLPNVRNITFKNAEFWGGSISGFERRYEGVPGRTCHLPPPLESLKFVNCWVTGGFNKLRRLCEQHGTIFRLWHDQRAYLWDRTLMSETEVEEWEEECEQADAVQEDIEEDGGSILRRTEEEAHERESEG